MIHSIILAAGKGSRMNSDIPKPLHVLRNKTLIERVLLNVLKVTDDVSIVTGYKGGEIRKFLGSAYTYVLQDRQLGTGHAVKCVLDTLKWRDTQDVLVLVADQPLISKETIMETCMVHQNTDSKITMTTAVVPHFRGDFGTLYECARVVRNNGQIIKLVEFKDSTESERMILEVNISCHYFDTHWLSQNIGKLKNDNENKEYYLTDMINLAINQDLSVSSYTVKDWYEGIGVNTQEQLVIASKYFTNN